MLSKAAITEIVDSLQLVYNGIELADGSVFKGAVAELRGDWKFQVETKPT